MLEWLADAQHVGANNPNDLPPYTTFNAGVTAQLTRGTLTFAATNITDAYSGIFASPANAVPYTTAGGRNRQHCSAARPTHLLRDVLGAVRTGRALIADGDGIPRAWCRRRPRRAGRSRLVRRSAAWARRSGRRARFSIALLAATTDAAGRSVRRRRQPDDVQRAECRQSSATLDRTQSLHRANRSCTNGSRLSGHDARAVAARCNRHVSRPRYDVRARDHAQGHRHAAGADGLHVVAHRARRRCVAAQTLRPVEPAFLVAQLNFMPAVGLYFVARQPQPGQEMFRVYKLTGTPPKDPFEVRTSPPCTGQVRDLATQSFSELKKHFSGGAPAPSWTITVHAAKAGTWYELDPGDATVVPAMMICGRVAATTPEELAQRGFDGKLIPELNYAPNLGLYLVRPAPRPSSSP